MEKLFLALLFTGLLAVGCASEPARDVATTGTTDTAMPEMDGMAENEGNVEIALVNPDETVPMGDAELVVAVTDKATGEPVTTDNMAVEVYMPMDGMEPMLAEAEVTAAGEPGQYAIATYLGMEGMWVVNAEVSEGDQQGKAHFMLEAK